MLGSIPAYLKAVVGAWWSLVVGVLGAALGVAALFIAGGVVLPVWIGVAIGIVGIETAQFIAFHRERQRRLQLELARGPFPKLDDSVLRVEMTERALPQLHEGIADGMTLGLRFHDCSGQGVSGCRLKAEQLDLHTDEGWRPQTQRPHSFFLTWEGQNAVNIPPSGDRTCWLVVAEALDPEDPRANLGRLWGILPGVWQVSLAIETDAFQVERKRYQFQLETARNHHSNFAMLRWVTEDAATSQGGSRLPADRA
jgi:hypothetical protein